MEAGTTRAVRARLPALSTATFLRFAVLALVALFLIVASGATVRLTGSGLGCENWPRCGETVLPERGFHAYVEFGNRIMGMLVGLIALAAAFAAWRAAVPTRLLVATLGLPLLVLVQGVLGGITVLVELHPLIVMAHFLLSLAALALAVVVAVGAWELDRGRRLRAEVPRWVVVVALGLVPLGLALVVSGAFATAAGPHSGGVEIERLWNLTDAVYVHVRVAAVFGIAFLVLAAALLRRRPRAPLASALVVVVFALLLVQMVVGEVHWRTQLPWAVVLAHVLLATAIWTGLVALAVLLRPAPARLAGSPGHSGSGVPGRAP